MGTSVSSPSPSDSNWQPSFACYRNSKVPEKRIIPEIWRASENQENKLSEELKSDSIYSCYNLIQESKNPSEALNKYQKSVFKNKSNSIVAELAKRAIPPSYQEGEPSDKWKGNLFSQVTNYVISRDASGFVGANFRNENIQDLKNFKESISSQVKKVFENDTTKYSSKEEWDKFIDSSIEKLKKLD